MVQSVLVQQKGNYYVILLFLSAHSLGFCLSLYLPTELPVQLQMLMPTSISNRHVPNFLHPGTVLL